MPKKTVTPSPEALIPDYSEFVPDAGKKAGPGHWHVVMSGAEMDSKPSPALKTRPHAEKVARAWLKQLRAQGCRVRGTMREGVFLRLNSGVGVWERLELLHCTHEHCEVGETTSKLQGADKKKT